MKVLNERGFIRSLCGEQRLLHADSAPTDTAVTFWARIVQDADISRRVNDVHKPDRPGGHTTISGYLTEAKVAVATLVYRAQVSTARASASGFRS
ncbi:MAG TPA: hypothetical protein VNA21_00545 [Steroidobacteraceae bacterium]|nr:hypothetical protein [Steroidobacteraceae bacterium]